MCEGGYKGRCYGYIMSSFKDTRRKKVLSGVSLGPGIRDRIMSELG